MRAILVDDERLALRQLKQMLERDVDGVEVIAMFSNPNEVIDGVLRHRPDVVFLDIHMPGVNGLNLARQIQSNVPNTEIVFVTAYDQYAVQAFDLYALDYIMKPIQTNRLQQSIFRLREKLNLKDTRRIQDSEAPYICCFNQIQFKAPGREVQTGKWRTSKAQELFAYLLYNRERAIQRSALLDFLWPDLEEGKAARQLYSTIYQIRQTLKNCGMEMITIHGGVLETGYRLDIGEARIDVEEWEYAMKQLKPLDMQTVEEYEKVMDLFKGDYLGNYDYIWAEHERERLRLMWLYHMRKLSDFYEQKGMLNKAVQVNHHVQQLLLDEEDSYFSLMKLYDAIGDKLRVEEQFTLLKARIERELESTVKANITQWYDQWRLKMSEC
ncbi:response regulator [Paenibacillus motobuensis]|uniref:Response regulator n=1 Tax=Paenibacillus motobuensis TaxID=295324 RepID=A0ABP3HUN8_9BACL